MSKPLFVSHLESDHTYCEDPAHSFFRRLSKLGFRPEKGFTEHPGGAVCNFIMVNELSGEARRGPYLEFVHLRNRNFEDVSGLSFRAPGGLEKLFRKLRGSEALGATLTHRNYDWQDGEEERRAGWNFVHFHKKRPRACNVWLTENEVPPAGVKRSPRKVVRHRNGARLIAGLRMELAERERTFFEALFRGRIRDRVILGCGTELLFAPAKRTRLAEVVLAMKDLDSLNRAKHGFALATWQGAPALRIAGAGPKMWDILLVQHQGKRH